MQNTATTVEDLVIGLRNAGGITLRTNVDLWQRIWKDRPVVADSAVTMLPPTETEASVMPCVSNMLMVCWFLRQET